MLKRFIQPDWGSWPLGSLSTEEITDWELRLPARTGVSRRTAQDARSLLCTILGDAAAARPPLIPYNPALRPRNRGRKTGRRLERSPQKIWATPLETLLIAERAALLSGADDFTLILTLGYTGMRWGEAIGLERQYLRAALFNVEWQLRELGGVFHRLPPKDDSYRSEHWEPCLPVDLPRFLAGLLSRPWLPVKTGLTPHGLRHGLRTWMTEDGIPEILAERRLGHGVPGMRGLYAHVSQRMRDDLTTALQARWEDSLRERAAIDPHSPIPLLDELLSPLRRPADHPRWETRPKLISQIPPNTEEDPIRRVG